MSTRTSTSSPIDTAAGASTGTRRPALRVSAGQAAAYRLAAHHLEVRLPSGWLGEATSVSAVPDMTPGLSALALAARVEALVPAELDRALLYDRSLLRLESLRGRAHVVARQHGAVFGPGALGADETSLRHQLLGDWLPLEAAGWAARDALAVVAGALAAVLADGEPRTRAELRAALHGQVPPTLEPGCERCGEHHVPDQLVRLAGTAGAYCYGRPRHGRAVLVNLDSWLDGPLMGSVDRARVELARRFVHAFAPIVPRRLAAWAGIGVDDARRRCGRLAFETVRVELADEPAWVLEADLDLLSDPPPASGVRLLAPDDPFLQQRDRAVLLAEPRARRQVWEQDERPGVVLVGGRAVATWRPQATEADLDIAVTPLDGRWLTRQTRLAIEEEAMLIAPFFGCDDVSVSVTP